MDCFQDETIVWAISKFKTPDSLQMFENKTRSLLHALRDTSPAFDRLIVVGKDRTSFLTSDVDFGSVVSSHVFDARNTGDYLNLRNEELGPETLSRIGFSLSFLSPGKESTTTMAEPGGIEIKLQGVSAGVESNASAVICLSKSSVLSLTKPPVVRQLLSLLIEKWRCDLAGVYLSKFRNAIRMTEQPSYAGQWLYYLPFPNLATCLPNDIHHEPFANGILIQTTPHMPDANNPADVAAGIRVREVLDEFGLVNDATYAIEGWPPDREEEIYEQFISGAPANRKYTVHCINFDGYDSQRKVLLYAKLFRRLKRHPKEWGLRGWDGPVLNEAKRQVRAAAKAGGVPIEWHIGLEEPAHQVRQLLADYTNITDQQLRVIYTPLQEALSRSKPQ
ncbi:hypothetical protein JM946_05025 [Steroidobacter sp. S1-65]|uniref:Uncharacterized protein n=1 Tax=Steroidobacter gossypii TaxID=2805490 RepID=A0ABS1WT26_9GAMM|nr:hypothetical protein [Steroidobacter gossypii]MBM0104093.1 hypothetical protein [Steroidobacter gossypii]